jgi:hypothetical protein
MKSSLLRGLLAIAALAGGQAYASAPETLVSCWDGTFAYNRFRLETTEQRVYVSLEGASLAGTDENASFNLWNHTELRSISGWGDSQEQWIVSFRLDQCQLDRAARTVTCEAGDLLVDDADQWTEAVFLNRELDDLGTPVQLVTRFPAQKLRLEVSPETGLTLSKSQRFPGTGEIETQKLLVERYRMGPDQLEKLVCENSMASSVPEKLVRFFEP